MAFVAFGCVFFYFEVLLIFVFIFFALWVFGILFARNFVSYLLLLQRTVS